MEEVIDRDKLFIRYMEEILIDYLIRMAQAGHYASGRLENTATTEMEANKDGKSYGVRLQDYWRHFEQGAQYKPWGSYGSGSTAFRDAIMQWIDVKGIIAKPHILPSGKSVVPSKQSLAFLIMRSIIRNGREPNGFLQASINKFKEPMLNDFAKLEASQTSVIFNEIKQLTRI